MKVQRILASKDTAPILRQLQRANSKLQKLYPGALPERQPIHTVYGGAHLFRHDISNKMGQAALKSLQRYAPNFVIFGKAMGMKGTEDLPESAPEIQRLSEKFDKKGNNGPEHSAWMPYQIYRKVRAKLESEPVEDFRIDFEDGYGNRPDAEEDLSAQVAAAETARGMDLNSLPPYIGIRIKPLNDEMCKRSIRTLDAYLTSLLEKTLGRLPANFVIMLPKVCIEEQVLAFVEVLELLESKLSLEPKSLRMEMMVETTQSIMDAKGANPLFRFVKASDGRCRGMHFGTYDYTASCGITARYQEMNHPVCDFAHHMTKVALAHTGIWLSDGATNTMPIGPHRGRDLTEQQFTDNKLTVHKAWKKTYDHIRHSLWNGYYQGWDLNPAQLPVRYAAVYAFFLESYEEAASRLKSFIESAARATLIGDIFDDAATGQGLLNYFLKALNCGAISENDLDATGLTKEEIQLRSFKKILDGRSSTKNL